MQSRSRSPKGPLSFKFTDYSFVGILCNICVWHSTVFMNAVREIYNKISYMALTFKSTCHFIFIINMTMAVCFS